MFEILLGTFEKWAPGQGHYMYITLYSWAGHFTLVVPLSTQGIYIGISEFNTEGNPALD